MPPGSLTKRPISLTDYLTERATRFAPPRPRKRKRWKSLALTVDIYWEIGNDAHPLMDFRFPVFRWKLSPTKSALGLNFKIQIWSLEGSADFISWSLIRLMQMSLFRGRAFEDLSKINKWQRWELTQTCDRMHLFPPYLIIRRSMIIAEQSYCGTHGSFSVGTLIQKNQCP